MLANNLNLTLCLIIKFTSLWNKPRSKHSLSQAFTIKIFLLKIPKGISPSPAVSNLSSHRKKSPKSRSTKTSITLHSTIPPNPSARPTLSIESLMRPSAKIGLPTVSATLWSTSSRMVESPDWFSVMVSPTQGKLTQSLVQMNSQVSCLHWSRNLSMSFPKKNSKLSHVNFTKMSSCHWKTKARNSIRSKSRAPFHSRTVTVMKSMKATWDHFLKIFSKTDLVRQPTTTVRAQDRMPFSKSLGRISRLELLTWPEAKEQAKLLVRTMLT